MFSMLSPARRRERAAESEPQKSVRPVAADRAQLATAVRPPAPAPAEATTTAPTAPATPPPAALAPAEPLNAVRRPAAEVPAITGLRISPHGIEAVLVNISESGLLAECGDRLKTGSSVAVTFEGTFAPSRVRGTVVRNAVSCMAPSGGLRYHIGIAFSAPISFDAGVGTDAPPVAEEVATIAEPVPVVMRAVRNRW